MIKSILNQFRLVLLDPLGLPLVLPLGALGGVGGEVHPCDPWLLPRPRLPCLVILVPLGLPLLPVTAGEEDEE